MSCGPGACCPGLAADATGISVTATGSGSRINAPSPRPNAFLAMCDNLLGKLKVGFCASTMNVVEHDRLPVTGGLGKPNVSGDNRFEDLRAKETSQIGGDL